MPTFLHNHKPMALGCWAIGGEHWGSQNERNSTEALETALEIGITHWDTAIAYGNGKSEQLCGNVLQGNRDKIFLATKGNIGKKPESLIKSLHKSLKNLRTDYLDLYYIHWPNSKLDMRQHYALLEKERSKGNIRYLGVSNFSVSQIKQVAEVGSIDAHQLCYNLCWRTQEKEVIPYCQQNEIPILAYSPLAMGILTGKFPKIPVFPQNDIRRKVAYFQNDLWPRIYAFTQSLNALARDANLPAQSIAIQWLLAQKGVTAPIVGARSKKQVQENAVALNSSKNISFTIQAASKLSDELHKCYPNEANPFYWNP